MSESSRNPPKLPAYLLQHGLSVEEAMRLEWTNSVGAISAEGISGAGRYKSCKGRHREFDDIS